MNQMITPSNHPYAEIREFALAHPYISVGLVLAGFYWGHKIVNRVLDTVDHAIDVGCSFEIAKGTFRVSQRPPLSGLQ
ncbi:MAG: hypothetical protein ACOX6G_10790 [Christensenellales bacterium]|jgi:hypothetical protein